MLRDKLGKRLHIKWPTLPRERKHIYAFSNSHLAFTEMTRKRWTTDSQEEWLKARIEGFIKAHHDKTLSKEYLPAIVKEFRDLWPVPPLTTEEAAADTTVELAMKTKRQKYDQVRSFPHKKRLRPSSSLCKKADKELVS